MKADLCRRLRDAVERGDRRKDERARPGKEREMGVSEKLWESDQGHLFRNDYGLWLNTGTGFSVKLGEDDARALAHALLEAVGEPVKKETEKA